MKLLKKVSLLDLQNTPSSTDPPRFGDPSSVYQPVVQIDLVTWVEMGNPTQITVRIEPGYVIDG